MPFHIPFWRSARAALRGACIAGLFILVACAGQAPAPLGAGGNTNDSFVRALADIHELYLEPISLKRVAVSGIAHLARLDDRLNFGDSFGTHFADALTLAYDGRDIAYFSPPADNDWKSWGGLIDQVLVAARQASPKIAALPPEQVDRAIFHGMTAALDGFSRYAGPEMAGDDRAARDGFGGIGVTVDTTDNLLRVATVSPRSPAELAGLNPGDQIVAIDGVSTKGCSEEDALHQLRGPVGSPIALRVLHTGGAQTAELQLRREFVTMPTVTSSRDGNILVVHVSSFNRSTAHDVAQALAEAQRQNGGLTGIILDLRGNGGGLLDQAVELADLFVASGPLVSTDGRHPKSHQYFAASGRSTETRLPMAVLINGGSASASEIVASALQDAGRAVVIGSSSYGKGTVQTVLRLPNNGELILTWARIIARSGYLLQQHGVVPTLCTASLPNDGADAAVKLQQAAAVTFAGGPRPRAGLDERGWAELRQLCPPLHTQPAVDVTLAERLLANPTLYFEALNALPASSQVAQGSATMAR